MRLFDSSSLHGSNTIHPRSIVWWIGCKRSTTSLIFPEKESDEQSVKNAIWVRVEGEARPIEISNRLTRLKPVTEAPAEKVRYYVPKDLQKDAQALRSHWK